MNEGYSLLTIRQEGDTLFASLPLANVCGNELSQSFREDCRRLVQQAVGPVLLDLRQVEFIDGSFFARLLELHRELKERSIRLTARLSPSLAEVARITKFDQILKID